MANVKINIKEWPRYMLQLGERARGAFQRGLVAGAYRCIPELQKRTEQAVPASENGRTGAINTGAYRSRWRVRVLSNGAAVFNDSAQSGVIDYGRRAGAMPPLAAIEKWARRRIGLSEQEAKRAAYPIARAIQRRGLLPRRVLTGADLGRIVIEEVRRELAAELRR